METLTDKLPKFKDFEKLLFDILCRTAQELTRQYLEWADMSIMALRDKSRYAIVNSRDSTIKALYGDSPYSRRYYHDNETGKYVFLLDELMEIDCGCGLFSENLVSHIVVECADKPFRKAADTISAITGQGVSPMGAWGVFQRFADSIAEQEERLKELYNSGDVGQLGNISTRVLFEEFDDVYIPTQKKKRRKRGEPVTEDKSKKDTKKKSGKKPMHVGISYTGWEQSGDGRCITANKMAYASFGEVSDFTEQFDALQSHCYDMDSVEVRLTNGDGAGWINKEAEEHNSILQLDPYHRSKAIVKSIGSKDDRKLLYDALDAKDVDRVLLAIWELYAKEENEKSRKKLKDLYEYFSNNRDSLLTWQERGVELPAPPEGITYRGMGAQEPNNCSLITLRMKHRRGSWSTEGGDNMSKVLCYRNTIGIDTILGDLPEPTPVEQFPAPLSAAETPLHDGKGYDAQWLYAQMPFEDTFKTNGREAIRGMLKMRPLSQLRM